MGKLHAGKHHVQFERRAEASVQTRLLRPDYPQTGLADLSYKPTSGPE